MESISLVPDKCVNSMRRVPESTVTAAPFAGMRVMGPMVTSNETTRLAGASPIFTCMVVWEPAGAADWLLFIDIDPEQAAIPRAAARANREASARLREEGED